MTDNSPQPLTSANFINAPYAANIWDTAPATIPFYDGYYLSPYWNTIQPIPVTGTIPFSTRIIASNQN